MITAKWSRHEVYSFVWLLSADAAWLVAAHTGDHAFMALGGLTTVSLLFSLASLIRDDIAKIAKQLKPSTPWDETGEQSDAS